MLTHSGNVLDAHRLRKHRPEQPEVRPDTTGFPTPRDTRPGTPSQVPGGHPARDNQPGPVQGQSRARLGPAQDQSRASLGLGRPGRLGPGQVRLGLGRPGQDRARLGTVPTHHGTRPPYPPPLYHHHHLWYPPGPCCFRRVLLVPPRRHASSKLSTRLISVKWKYYLKVPKLALCHNAKNGRLPIP